jgi:hypothetical protein
MVLLLYMQDHVTDLLTTMDASQVNFDIVSNCNQVIIYCLFS